MNCISIVFLFTFLHSILSNQEIILTSTNYFSHIACIDKLYIRINSIKFFYTPHNCIIDLHDYEKCSNQSSCRFNFKSILFTHIQHDISKCRKIKLKSIRLNYTCGNETLKSIKSRKNTIILFISIVSFVSLLALFCSYLRYFLTTTNDSTDNQNKQEYELKNLLVIKSASSSSSTLTSLNNKNLITNLSEYDNLINEHLSTLKVKFNENYET